MNLIIGETTFNNAFSQVDHNYNHWSFENGTDLFYWDDDNTLNKLTFNENLILENIS